MSTKRLGYITAEQKETLIEFMKQNDKLKSGKFSDAIKRRAVTTCN